MRYDAKHKAKPEREQQAFNKSLMGQHQIFTPGKIFGFSVFLFTVAQTLGQLNHSTSGHVFMVLAFVFSLWSLILWIRDNRFPVSKRQQDNPSSASLPSLVQTEAQLPPPKTEPAMPQTVMVQPEPVPQFYRGPMIHSDESWRQYTRDVFYNAIWTWHYKPEFGKTPLGLTPFCSECAESEALRAMNTERGDMIYMCWACNEEYVFPVPQERDFRFIKDDIKKKLEDGTWRDVVSRQRYGR